MDSKQTSKKALDSVLDTDTIQRYTDGRSTINRGSDHEVGQFGNFLQFWLTGLGFAVGYGNIWRFPYLLYSNGGGVFLIPFFICIAFVSFPIYYLETAYGQLYKRTLHTYFDTIKSRFIGVSFAVVSIVFFMGVYYNCLIAWSGNFFLFSFQSNLPWAINEDLRPGNEDAWNETYFKDEFLQMSEGIFDITHHIPWIIASFVIVTAITFITEYRSLDTATMAIWVFIPSAYIILSILFIKGIMLEGNTIGWAYLFEPDWSKLFTLQIWRDAGSQSIFSAGLGIHAVILFASHKSRGEPIFIPAIGVPILNFSTSIFAAIALFSFIGHASYKTGIPINDMPIDGLELAFVAYPALLSTFPFPQIWSALFFLMLIFIGLSTQIGFVDVTGTFIQGMFFRFQYVNVSKTLLTFIVCTIILLIDIALLASNAGYHWVDFLDHYVVGINLVISLTLQLIIFGHYLPLEDMEQRVELMGENFPRVYKIGLKYITPTLGGSLALIGVINEIKNPPDLPFMGKLLALGLFLLPNILGVTFYFLDPWNPRKGSWQQDNIKILQSVEAS